MPPLKFACRLWLHYPISRWDRPSSAVKSIQRATQSNDLDFEKPDLFIDENHETMDETMDESWIPHRIIMRRNLTGMMSFHLGRLGNSQHTPAENHWRLVHLPRNRPGFITLKSCNVLQVPRLMREKIKTGQFFGNNVGRRLTFPSILRTESVRKPRGFQKGWDDMKMKKWKGKPMETPIPTFKLHIFSGDSEPCGLDPYGSIWSKLKLNFGMECHISLLWVEQADIMIAAVWVAFKASSWPSGLQILSTMLLFSRWLRCTKYYKAFVEVLLLNVLPSIKSIKLFSTIKLSAMKCQYFFAPFDRLGS